ncbi:MAG: LruC domain-containing protein, partial [Alistipes sp.]
MKKISLILAVAAAIVLIGCAKDASGVKPIDESAKFTDLKVSDNFDWAMISDIKCAFTASHTSKVALATSTDAEPFATFMVSEGMKPMVISVPRTLQTLYVRYQTQEGTWKSSALPVSETVSFVVPSDSYAYAASRAADNKVMGQVVYPDESTWGTLLFEDYWPAYGDYDFNDMVISYRIEEDLNKEGNVMALTIKTKVLAIGGYLPFNFGLSLFGVYSQDIASAEVVLDNKASNKVAISSNRDVTNKVAVVKMTGLRDNNTRPNTDYTVNTLPNTKPEKFVEANFKITFVNPVEQMFLTMNELNFFIYQIDNANRHIEIHLGGQKPTAEALSDYMAIRDATPLLKGQFKNYYSNDNLVWALNVPAAIQHACEKGNFLEAYPDFKGWVTSNGAQNKDWYKHGD